MELIINIDEDVRIAITRMGLLRIPDEMQKKVDKAIQHGKPLPKGHGKLIDADDVKSYFSDREGDDFTAFHFYDAVERVQTIIEADKENPLDEYSPMVEEMKQMMRGNTEVVSEFVESDIFDEIMDDESEDEETYEKIKEIIEKVKEQEE